MLYCIIAIPLFDIKLGGAYKSFLFFEHRKGNRNVFPQT
jgi:hypothetical protein